MAIKRTSEAQWKGSIKDGGGSVKLGSGAFEGPYSFGSRFGDDVKHTNPEELIAAAHAACFSMAFSLALGNAGYEPTNIDTTAAVFIDKRDDGFVIPKIELTMEAEIPDIGEDEFQAIAKAAKEGCPVSRVLAAADISLNATLK